MKYWAISEQTRERLGKLYVKEGFLSGLFKNRNFQVEILAELSNSKEPGVIPALTVLLFDSNPKLRLAARDVVHVLLQSVPEERLLELDELMRQVYDNNWRGIHPENLDNLPDLDHTGSLLGLVSFHPNGRIREAALKILEANDWDDDLPYLLIRLNDWVVQVRNRADNAIQRRLDSRHASRWLRSLPIILRLESWSRANHATLIASVGALFQRPECHASLQEGLAANDRNIRRLCLRFALGCEREARSSILEQGLLDRDPLIRWWISRQLLSEASLDALSSLVYKLLKDSSMLVRREALQTLVDKLPDAAMSFLEKAVFDRNMAIREIARYYLMKSKQVDVAQMYREALKTETGYKLVAAICGIGEAGTPEDVPLVWPFLEAKNIHQKCSAYAAISRLSKDEFIEEFVMALEDESPRVSQAVYRALIPRFRRANQIAVVSLLNNSNLPHVRKNAFRLVRKMGKWERLPLFLDRCSDSDAGIAEMARQWLRAWLVRYNDSFAEPKKPQIQSCQASLDANASSIDGSLVSNLQAVLDEWLKRLNTSSRNT